MTTTPRYKSNGHQFNGSVGKGAEAPAASPLSSSRDGSASEIGRRPMFEPPTVIREGMAMPGTPYTGAYIEYRNPSTGHVRIEWAGELHGEWESKRDPAAELIAGLSGTQDGYLPYRAVLCSPHSRLEGATSERDVPLLGGQVLAIAQRLHAAERGPA